MSQGRNQNEIDFNSPSFSAMFPQYGTSPKEFINSVAELEKKFNFTITPSIFDSKNPPGKLYIHHSYVSFVYYCKALDNGGVDVTNLAGQFRAAKKARSFKDIRHASSLARLGFILHRKGHAITFPKIENGDLNINGIRAE